MRGNAAIFILIGALVIIGVAVFYSGLIKSDKFGFQGPQPTPYNISKDPKYAPVKEKYNLDEEQLQILSTVNPDDND